MSHVYMANRGQRSPAACHAPQGESSAMGKWNPHLEGLVRWEKLPLRRRRAQRRAQTEPLPVARPTAGLAARPADLREAPQWGQWGRGGHTHGGGQALFPSLAETRPLLPSLPESRVVLTRLCLVRH